MSEQRFIDRLIAASPTARRKFTILGQDIYVKPLTRQAMADAMPDDDVQRPKDYASLFLIVHAAEAEDGSKLFRRDDIEKLRTLVSLDLLRQVEQGLLGVLAPDDAAVDTLVASDPPSASA